MDGPVETGRKAVQTPGVGMAECALARVRDIILVVSNDEDICEVTSIPLASDTNAHTLRGHGALLEAAKL